MKKICFIAPYQQLFQIAKQVVETEKYNDVSVVLGDLEKGVEKANEALEDGAELLISRGGTYTMIREKIKDANIFELKISALDIMNSMRYVLERNKAIGIIGYYNIIYGYDILSELMGTKMKAIFLNDQESVEEKIKKCADEGVECFIGDTIVNRVCENMGYECYMIESSVDSVKMCLEQAREALKSSQEILEKNRSYRALMDCVHEGVLALNEGGNILTCNRVTEEMTGISKNQLIGKKLGELPGFEEVYRIVSREEKVADEVVKVGETKISLNCMPVIVNGKKSGTILSIQDIQKLQNYEMKIRSRSLEKGFKAKYTFDSICYKSKIMEECIETAKKYSKYDSPILIQGESGVGKELFAQSIHNASIRKNKPFVAVNCAALAESIIESELFGYTEGAFTGARKGGKAGLFEMAHRGTIFLDEISELPLNVQGQLLRVLQEKEIMRLGDSKVTPLDIRIICATNKNLNKMVEDGRFRQDLLYRINTLRFTIPKLDERKEDILMLAGTFMKSFSDKYSKDIRRISYSGGNYLLNYNYKGNVRELRGMIERAVILSEGTVITEQDLRVRELEDELEEPKKKTSGKVVFEEKSSLKEIEDAYIMRVWMQQNQSTTDTCKILKINRSTLWRKLKQMER